MSLSGDTRGPSRSGRPDDDEPPPFLGSWNRLYAAVLGFLALLVVLFYIITVSFS
jgi:hypothetical protein